MPKTVLVPIADGTEEIEAVCLIDTLRRAGAEVTVASVMLKKQIKASRGVQIVADALIGECAQKTYDLIALPGGMPGAEHLRDSRILVEMLQKQSQESRLYAAICAAPAVVFEHHGLLEGKAATCHPAFVPHLKDQTAAAQRVVVAGNCVTSRAPGTALEFAITLVELLYGAEHAAKVAQPMLIWQGHSAQPFKVGLTND